jgi:hypothetical protein
MIRSMSNFLTTSSCGRKRWVVTRGGRRRVVDLEWPGFSNWIAVDGAVVETWSWPGNNLYTTRRFSLDGVPATVIRQRTGLLNSVVTLEVGAPDAVVQELPVDGVGRPENVRTSKAGLVAVLFLIFGILALAVGFPIAGMVIQTYLPEYFDEFIAFVVVGAVCAAPLTIVVVVLVIMLNAVRSSRR